MYKPLYKGTEIFDLFSFRMGILHLAIVIVIISLSTLLTAAALNDLGYSIEKYDDPRESIMKIEGLQYCTTMHGGLLCMLT